MERRCLSACPNSVGVRNTLWLVFQHWEWGLWGFLHNLLKLSQSTWFLVPPFAHFPLNSEEYNNLFFSCGLCISVARFSDHKLSFCKDKICLLQHHHNHRGGGESKELRLSLVIRMMQIKNSNVFTRLEICNPGQLYFILISSGYL